MVKIKIILLVLLLTAILIAAQPSGIRAYNEALTLPPSITLIQDKENPMLIKHSFDLDNSISVNTGDTEIDDGFYVHIQKTP